MRVIIMRKLLVILRLLIVSFRIYLLLFVVNNESFHDLSYITCNFLRLFVVIRVILRLFVVNCRKLYITIIDRKFRVILRLS